MRILHVAESMATGVLQVIRQICSAMADKHDIYVLHGHRTETPGDLHSLFPASVKFFTWNAGREISVAGDIAAIRQLTHIIRELRPDIVHAHSSKAGALCRLAALLVHSRLIYTPHAYSFLRQDLSNTKRAMYWTLEWMLGRIPHLTVASSLSEFSHALRVSDRVILISNCVDVMDAKHGPARHKNGRFRAVMVGSIRPQKNFRLFCQIAARPRCRDFDFVWVGGGTLPSDCTIPSNVRISGFLPRAAALAEVQQADVFVLTSQWETLCIAALEAMALGKPVLANPGAGTAEMILIGVNGYICKTPEEFEARLAELAENPRKAAEMGHASEQLYEQRYCFDRIRSQWESTYAHFDLYRQYPATF